MTTTLTPEQTDAYWADGFLSGLRAFPEAEAAKWLAELEAIEAAEIEARGGAWTSRDYRPWDHEDHPMVPWLDALARHPAILDAVEGVLGPNILVRNCDVFIKNPGVRRGIGWHQDTAERGPDADGLLTVWLGLTPSTPANGGMRFSRGSHRLTIPGGPKDRFTLTFTKEAAAHLDPAASVDNVMEPGQFSMHHFRTAHTSGPNRSDARRVAFVGRYMRADISQETAESGAAVLVRGENTGTLAIKDRFPMTWTM